MKTTATELCYWWNEETDRLYQYYIKEGKNEYLSTRIAAAATRPVYINDEEFSRIWRDINEIYTTYQACSHTTSIMDWMEMELVYDEVVRCKREEIRARFVLGGECWERVTESLNKLIEISEELGEALLEMTRIVEQFRDELEESNICN